MTAADRLRMAKIIIPGLIAGGACGMGVGLGLYPPAVGITGSIVVAAITGLVVYRARNSKPVS